GGEVVDQRTVAELADVVLAPAPDLAGRVDAAHVRADGHGGPGPARDGARRIPWHARTIREPAARVVAPARHLTARVDGARVGPAGGGRLPRAGYLCRRAPAAAREHACRAEPRARQMLRV